jgi:hypothetical protein
MAYGPASQAAVEVGRGGDLGAGFRLGTGFRFGAGPRFGGVLPLGAVFFAADFFDLAALAFAMGSLFCAADEVGLAVVPCR